jgi:hypothetical protein
MKRKATLFITLLAAALTQLSAAPASSKLTDDQKIVHLLNRISFGPRPGDIDRVRKLGIDRYIEEQLHPERIDDSRADSRLSSFPSIKMGARELNENYVTPSNVARELGLINARKQQQPNATQDAAALRNQLQTIMKERGLKPQQNLLRELQGQKLVRAVSSERQLQEVMTDFWFNHFNVYWGKGADKQLTTDLRNERDSPPCAGQVQRPGHRHRPTSGNVVLSGQRPIVIARHDDAGGGTDHAVTAAVCAEPTSAGSHPKPNCADPRTYGAAEAGAQAGNQ